MSRIRRLGIATVALLAALATGACGTNTITNGGGPRGKASAFQGYREGVLTCPTDWRGVNAPAGLRLRAGPGGVQIATELLRDAAGNALAALPAGTRFTVVAGSPGELAELNDTFYSWRRVGLVHWNGEEIDVSGESLWVAENTMTPDIDTPLASCGVRPLDRGRLTDGEFSVRRRTWVTGDTDLGNDPRDGVALPARFLEGAYLPEGWRVFNDERSWSGRSRKVDVKDNVDGDFVQLSCDQCSFGLEKTFAVPAGRHIVWVPMQLTIGSGQGIDAAVSFQQQGQPAVRGGSSSEGERVEMASLTVEGPTEVTVRLHLTRDLSGNGAEAAFYGVQILPAYDPNTRAEGMSQLGTLPVSKAAFVDAEVFEARSPASDPYAAGRLPHGFMVAVGDDNLPNIDNATYDRRVQVVDDRLLVSTRGGYWGVSTSFYGLADSYRVSVPLQVIEGAVNDVTVVVNYVYGIEVVDNKTVELRRNKVVKLDNLIAGDWAVAELDIADYFGQMNDIRVVLLVHGVWSPDRGNAPATVAFDGIWIEEL